MRNRGNFINEIVKIFDKDHSDYYYGRIYEILRKGMTVTKSPYDPYWFGLSETEFIEDPENRIEEIPISEFIDWIEKEGIEKGRFMYDFQFEHQVFSQEKCFIPGKKQTIQVERLLLSTEFYFSARTYTYSDGQSNCNLSMWLSPNSDRTEWSAIVVNPDDNHYKTQFATLKTVSDLQRLNTLIPQRYLSDYDVIDDDDCLEDIMNNYLDQDEDE